MGAGLPTKWHTENFSILKNVFKRRLDYVREVLTPAGQSDLDNYGLISAIFDSAIYNKSSTPIKVVIYYYQQCN